MALFYDKLCILFVHNDYSRVSRDIGNTATRWRLSSDHRIHCNECLYVSSYSTMLILSHGTVKLPRRHIDTGPILSDYLNDYTECDSEGSCTVAFGVHIRRT